MVGKPRGHPRSCVTTMTKHALVCGRAHNSHDVDLVARSSEAVGSFGQDDRRLHRQRAASATRLRSPPDNSVTRDH